MFKKSLNQEAFFIGFLLDAFFIFIALDASGAFEHLVFKCCHRFQTLFFIVVIGSLAFEVSKFVVNTFGDSFPVSQFSGVNTGVKVSVQNAKEVVDFVSEVSDFNCYHDLNSLKSLSFSCFYYKPKTMKGKGFFNKLL